MAITTVFISYAVLSYRIAETRTKWKWQLVLIRGPAAIVAAVGIVVGQLFRTEVRLEAVMQRDTSLPDPPTAKKKKKKISHRQLGPLRGSSYPFQHFEPARVKPN